MSKKINTTLFRNHKIRVLVLAFSIVFIITAVGWFRSTSEFVVVSEGELFNVTKIAQSTDGIGEAEIFFPTVKAQPVDNFNMLKCELNKNCETLKLFDTNQQIDNQLVATETIDVAAKAVKKYVNETSNLPSVLTPNHSSVTIAGASSGLAVGLYALDNYSTNGLFKTQRIAATGVINNDGKIGPIAGIELKTKLIVKNNIDVFYVPQANYRQAKSAAQATDLTIVPVKTLQDVITHACQDKTNRSSLCGRQ